MHNPGTNVVELSTLFEVGGAHMERIMASRMSLGTGLHCVLGRVVQDSPSVGWCVRGRIVGRLSVETRVASCRPDSSQLLMGQTEQPIFAILFQTWFSFSSSDDFQSFSFGP